MLLANANIHVAQNIGFGFIAVVMLVAALSVVTTNNVVHAALWLALVLGGVAAQYVLAAAEFVAISQILVYIGAVMVLFLFGIMLTRAQIGREIGLNNATWAVGIPVAAILMGLLGWVVIDAVFNNSKMFANVNDDGVIRADSPIAQQSQELSTQGIADGVLAPYLVPFFGMTFVLLAAAIGAIVLARKD